MYQFTKFNHILKTPFTFYHAEHSFNGRGVFSFPNIHTAIQEIPTFDRDMLCSTTLENLIEINLEELNDQGKQPASVWNSITTLAGVLKEKVILDDTRNEKEYVVEFSKKVLIPLFGEVELELGYSQYIVGVHGAKVEFLGLGSDQTWHGSTEVRMRGCDFIVTMEHSDNESDSDSDEDDAGNVSPSSHGASPGNTISIEGKCKIKSSDLGQLVETCITYSFTEHNVHPALNSMVPTILLNKCTVRIAIYDAVHDVLLISAGVRLAMSNCILRDAIFFLWIIINHR